jgi:WD40 repeat protein
MLAHPAAISALSLSPDGRELVSAGHDASLRFWSLEKRSCTQEITSHRLMRGEGVCAVVWSQDGRWVVSGGGDGVVKVFARWLDVNIDVGERDEREMVRRSWKFRHGFRWTLLALC